MGQVNARQQAPVENDDSSVEKVTAAGEGKAKSEGGGVVRKRKPKEAAKTKGGSKKRGAAVASSASAVATSAGDGTPSGKKQRIREGSTAPTDEKTPVILAPASVPRTAAVPQLVTQLTDNDVIIPVTEDPAVLNRPANVEYIQTLQANCALFHTMAFPAEQHCLLQNIFDFLTTIRGLRFVTPVVNSSWMTVSVAPLQVLHAEMTSYPVKWVRDQLSGGCAKVANRTARSLVLSINTHHILACKGIVSRPAVLDGRFSRVSLPAQESRHGRLEAHHRRSRGGISELRRSAESPSVTEGILFHTK